MNVLGVPAELEIQTAVHASYAAFADKLESELAAWQGFETAADAAKEGQRAWHEKTYDAYREIAAQNASPPPTILTNVLEHVERIGA